MDQLDWVNPEDNRGRHVIPFAHFINNDLEYLWGGASSRKYTTSVTETKAADYGNIKWIEDLVPHFMFAVNRESALDVYSKMRIIAVTDLKIVEWHSYKHLDRLRMFTRSIVIQRSVEDLQLGVKSYQKRLNLTKPDTYRSDLKQRKAYTAYSNPRGFIYQNKDKKNRLMRIDELHKFSDGTLNDVQNALDDCLKGIKMQYLPQTIWKKVDKDRAAAMIQAINKMLKTRRIMRSLERNLYKALVEAYEVDKIILDTYGETVTLKRRRDDESEKDERPSTGSDRGSKRRREGKEPESASAPLQTATRSAGRSTTGSKSRQASASESGFAEEPVLTTSQIEEPSHSVFKTDTPLDFSIFIMNRLRVDTLTPKLLAGSTYELMKGSCKSLTELEYHLEEVYKAMTDQLDWVNPEGQQYPYNLLQPLPLIPDNRGRRVIPFAHFINNDLEYLRGEPINYDKHAIWEVSHWGRKRQQFYGFDVNQESALDVYSKRRIITVTDLKIVEWHGYKHLD
nr:hypothetical protein [Tanacetum cinerariifolium]